MIKMIVVVNHLMKYLNKKINESNDYNHNIILLFLFIGRILFYDANSIICLF